MLSKTDDAALTTQPTTACFEGVVYDPITDCGCVMLYGHQVGDLGDYLSLANMLGEVFDTHWMGAVGKRVRITIESLEEA